MKDIRRGLEIESANDFATQMQGIQSALQDEMQYAQDVYEDQSNRHRQPAPDYSEGDLVYLSSRNLRTLRPSKKLDWKQLGPYPVEARVGSHAYRIQMPGSVRILYIDTID